MLIFDDQLPVHHSHATTEAIGAGERRCELDGGGLVSGEILPDAKVFQDDLLGATVGIGPVELESDRLA